MVRVYKRGQVVEVPDGYFSLPPPPTADMVKQEAGRRILAIAPEWRQINMLARAAELLRIGEPNWTLLQQAEVAAMDAAWADIEAIRAKSNAIEAMDPIPSDYAADKYWI
jgi:hypothetical protein